MSVLRDTCDTIGCRRLWAHVFAMQWDISFGNARATRLECTQALRWFGSEDFFIVCTLLELDGHAVLQLWKKQQQRMADGETGFIVANPAGKPSRMTEHGGTV